MVGSGVAVGSRRVAVGDGGNVFVIRMDGSNAELVLDATGMRGVSVLKAFWAEGAQATTIMQMIKIFTRFVFIVCLQLHGTKLVIILFI